MREKDKMVSIVIPVYNVEKYLDKCVESVLKLKTEIEVILVDDGSKDHSGILCEDWARKDKRIRVIHQENRGLSAARNTGILESKGEYIMFLDSDDFLDPLETDSMLEAQEYGADSILGLYREYYTGEDHYVKETCDAFLHMKGLVDINNFLKEIPKDGRSCYMVAPRFVVSRAVVLKNNLYFVSGIYHEDEEWTQRLLCSINNIFICHNYFYQYRQAREGSITFLVKSKHIKDRFSIIERAEKKLQCTEQSIERVAYLQSRMGQMYLSNMIDWRVLDKSSKGELKQQFKIFEKKCVPYMCGTIGTLVKISTRIFGVWGTCFMLSIARRVIKGN